MNQTEIKYITNRVNEVTKCVNGTISTKINNFRKNVGITSTDKIRQIRNGEAKLKPDYELARIKSNYRSGVDFLENFFDFKVTAEQKKKKAFNKRLVIKEEELHTTVELEGKKIIDSVVLGIIKKADLPAELERLGRMVSIVNNVC